MKTQTTQEAAAKLNAAIAPAVSKFAPPEPGSEEEAEAIKAGNEILEKWSTDATSCSGSGQHEEDSPAE